MNGARTADRFFGVLGKVQGADIPGVTEICAPFYSEAPREVFLRRFLEPSSCTIMGAGDIECNIQVT